MIIWNEEDSDVLDSDDCMIVDEIFLKVFLKKGKIVLDINISLNQLNIE